MVTPGSPVTMAQPHSLQDTVSVSAPVLVIEGNKKIMADKGDKLSGQLKKGGYCG